MQADAATAQRITPRYQFASDNYAGMCPEAWEAMAEANAGCAPSYGDDAWTQQACDLLREIFETDCEVFFTLTGTAANGLALASLCQSYHSVLCHRTAHIETDECGAPEFFTHGTKILFIDGPAGKVDPAAMRRTALSRTDIHFPKARVVSLTQATELGTVYHADELAGISEEARRLGLRMHMDGARFANAVAGQGLPPKALSWQAGVDVLCLGGAKNGLALGEAVVFFNRELAHEFDYRCKQAGQLLSKMRFVAAQWVGILRDGAWLRRAAHANRCACRLAGELAQIPGISVRYPCEANAVFANFPDPLCAALHDRGWHFYTFIGDGGARLMCSWATRDEDIDALVGDIRELALKTSE